MGKQKRKIIHSFSSENQLYLLKIDFSVVRLSRLFAMISLLLSFVSSVLLLFLAENIFWFPPSILRIRNRFASKKTPLKKSRIFLRSKREKTQKKKNTKKFKKKQLENPLQNKKKKKKKKKTENPPQKKKKKKKKKKSTLR